MEKTEILEKLCSYDKRNPSFYEDEWNDPREPRIKGCACDNCFYGRDELVLELIKLQDELDDKMKKGKQDILL